MVTSFVSVVPSPRRLPGAVRESYENDSEPDLFKSAGALLREGDPVRAVTASAGK